MATSTITLPNGTAVYHRSPGTIPADTLDRTRLADQNVAKLAACVAAQSLPMAIADPGASGAIPVNVSGYVPLVTAAAETRTLAVPTFAGQLLLLELKTDGGDCTITVAQAIDEYGTTSIVLNDAGDAVLLAGVYSGANLRWRVIANRGVDSVPVRGPLESLVADPGASGAIAVTRSGHVELVTAAAETRTLAAPSFNGQMLLISLKTDQGDCVITCATTVNQTGNNTITLDDAGDALLLVAKQNGANLRWSVVSNDGTTLSTV